MRRVPLIQHKCTLHFNNQQRHHGQQYNQQYNHYRQRPELYRKYKFLPQHDRYHSYSQQALRALLLDHQFKWEMLHLVLILLHGIRLLSQNQLLLIKSYSPVMVLDSHLVGVGMLSWPVPSLFALRKCQKHRKYQPDMSPTTQCWSIQSPR